MQVIKAIWSDAIGVSRRHQKRVNGRRPGALAFARCVKCLVVAHAEKQETEREVGPRRALVQELEERREHSRSLREALGLGRVAALDATQAASATTTSRPWRA